MTTASASSSLALARHSAGAAPIGRALLLLGAVVLAGICAAQTYPTKSVRVVIPWPPGGSNDIAGRTVLQRVAEATGQPFIIDNRGGAGGIIGADLVAKAPADGYTIMVHSTTHVANAHLHKRLPYDTLRDFVTVSLLSAQTSALVVHPSVPARSVAELIALARARPNEILYASAGNGSAPHMAMALFAAMTGTALLHVPYKGGAAQVTALVSGEASSAIAGISVVLAHVKSGRLRALGVTSARRSGTLPDVPTIAQAGVPGYEMDSWVAVFAPAGTPRAVLEKLNTEINKVLESPPVRQTLAAAALDPLIASQPEAEHRIRSDHEKYGKLIRLTGAQAE